LWYSQIGVLLRCTLINKCKKSNDEHFLEQDWQVLLRKICCFVWLLVWYSSGQISSEWLRRVGVCRCTVTGVSSVSLTSSSDSQAIILTVVESCESANTLPPKLPSSSCEKTFSLLTEFIWIACEKELLALDWLFCCLSNILKLRSSCSTKTKWSENIGIYRPQSYRFFRILWVL